ncbi:MAG: hypothetical protein ABIB71_08240 [Candidatus Woesearchaeota archaeon]
MKKQLNLFLGVILGIALAVSLVAVAFPTAFNKFDFSKAVGRAVSIFSSDMEEYGLKDQCGPIMGSILHTIDDEGSCIQKCKINCLSKDKEYGKVEFKKEVDACNICTCYCKE